MIRHKDGVILPMDTPYYEATLIAPGTWKIMSSGDYHYLVLGKEEGISIDTGYGAGNLRLYLEKLGGLPVKKAVNTHHHFDHTANNCYFDIVYMAEESVPLASIPYPSFYGINFPKNYPVKIVKDGDYIPLPGRELEVFRIGDHTDDGIALLDRKERLLFTGDELMPMGKRISKSVKKFNADMEKLGVHRSEFDRICGGTDVFNASMFDAFLEASRRILKGERSSKEMTVHTPMKTEEEERTEDGQLIYDCQHPHPEDRPGGNTMGKGSKKLDEQPSSLMKHGLLVLDGYRFTFNEEETN